MLISLLVLELRQTLFIMDLPRNLKIEKISVFILSNNLRLDQVTDIKFAMGVSYELLLTVKK